MKPKHQVFVSSTYSDLKAERETVESTLLKLGSIPTGMEQFPASAKDPWSLIEEVIDGCDYFVLILAGRYGSMDPSGLGYTEREYRYAKSRNIPILPFLRRDLSDLNEREGQLETDLGAQERLRSFRDSVERNLHCNYFDTPDELAAALATSLPKIIESHPRGGWVRANSRDRSEKRIQAGSRSLREVVRELPETWLEQIRPVVTTSGVLNRNQFSIQELSKLNVLEERLSVSETESRYIVSDSARYFVEERLRYVDLAHRKEKYERTKYVMQYERSRRPAREALSRLHRLLSPEWWEEPNEEQKQQARQLLSELESAAENLYSREELLEGDQETLRSIIGNIRVAFRRGWPLTDWPETMIAMWLAEWNEDFDGLWPGDHVDDYDPAVDYWLGRPEAEIMSNLSYAETWGLRPDSPREKQERYKKFLDDLDRKARESG